MSNFSLIMPHELAQPFPVDSATCLTPIHCAKKPRGMLVGGLEPDISPASPLASETHHEVCGLMAMAFALPEELWLEKAWPWDVA